PHHHAPPPFPTRRSSDLLHLAPSAVQLLVQRLLFPTAGTERGHHETAIFPLRQIFRLAHYTALSTPTLASPVLKVGKDSGGFSPDRKSTRLNSSHVKISY